MDYFLFFTTDNKSGWKCRKEKLARRHPNIYNEIISFISQYPHLSELSFVQQVYHFIYNLIETPICPECGNSVLFFDIRRGYQQFCSTKCANSNKIKIEQIKQTNTKKYNSTCPMQNKKIKEQIEKNNVKNFGFSNPFYSPTIQDNIHNKLEQKFGYKSLFQSPEFRKQYNGKTSKIEKNICQKIGGQKFYYKDKEYDIIVDNDIFEIDGDFWHPKEIKNLTFAQINTLINDKIKKDNLINTNYNLYKIYVSNVDQNNVTIDNLKLWSHEPQYNINTSDIIISKEYLKKYINTKGQKKLNEQVTLLLKFIRTFHPQFPYHIYNEDIISVKQKINKYDVSKVYDKKTNTFKNNTYTLGCGALKNKFPSFWNSKYKNNKSPIEIWNDDDLMYKIIAYRIGLNDSGEIFDFSIKEIIKGISAIKGTVSFFKPIVAASIYEHYLPNIINPVVFDPCGGFGGRMFGFKSKYPNGKYIGLEPNIDTYNELSSLSNNFSDVILYNTTLEDFNVEINYDIAFTSIPYFDLEIYTNNPQYNSFEEWRQIFIGSLLKYPRLLINMSMDLCKKLELTDYIDTYLSNNISHLNKNKTTKLEVIVKLNF